MALLLCAQGLEEDMQYIYLPIATVPCMLQHRNGEQSIQHILCWLRNNAFPLLKQKTAGTSAS